MDKFVELAKQHSKCPSGQNGGNLGLFGRGMMVKPFEDTAFGLSVGQLSAPVQTQFGWHLIVRTS
jgi:parvulin-like peptidyl-prolyl isomerase